MTKEKMTIHEALCEVKMSDKKILKVLDGTDFVVPNRASNKKITGIDIEEYKNHSKEQYQRVTDYIKRANAIKAALNDSNAKTKIKVGSTEMSIAEAIYQKDHGTAAKEALLSTLKSQLAKATRKIEAENGENLDRRVDKVIAETYGNNQNKIEADQVEATRKTFIEQNQYVLVDPIDIKKEITRLEEEIDEFKINVDSAIQISNATTEIEIEY